MNLHDMAKRPGAHLVTEEFGVEDSWALSDDHPPRDPRSPADTTAKPSRSR
ncbi:hypothetical protein AB0D59_35520 [Streptomyces sp. NPDC048417]|uniref:hypothetical protein n=1 Tax=Streptomyces sp. NPDC048417 TaxID=3155387 RepID=UPI003439CBBB